MNQEEVKEKIVETFQKLIIANGIKKMTMEKLARECGISKKTVYKFYDSKDELIEQFIEGIAGKIQQGFSRLDQTSADPEETMFLFFDLVFEITRNLPAAILEDAEKYYPNLGEKINLLREEISIIFAKTIKKGVSRGSFKNINPAFAEKFYFGALNNIFSPEFMLKTGLGVNEILDSFKSMLLTGLLKEKVESRLEIKEPAGV
ncbi:MAG TPA: TetR/AcrR family transcriptional regulator [Spirochaetota bacterium]|nr:TetR/AcrR family transcriptional regulator [Spirochaetota bacterium]HRZ27465.1 TetR/AcrR family transcriptional regulator [Spirochaetota bacterium]HSA13784.1 TetR/AcrR family transcriptional regulator [Spirochaetota bacterium]